MADVSVLLIGASGILGKPLLAELVHQRSQFKRVAILTTPGRAAKFNDAAGVEVVVGSLFDGKSYQGQSLFQIRALVLEPTKESSHQIVPAVFTLDSLHFVVAS